MLEYSIVSLMMAMVTAVLGFALLTGPGAWFAKLLFAVATAVFMLSLVVMLAMYRRQPRM